VPSRGARSSRLYPTAAAITTHQFRNASPCSVVVPHYSGTIWGARVCDLSSSASCLAVFVRLAKFMGTNSTSPTSRAPSAVGSAADRLVRPRTSEGGVPEGQPTAREHLGYTSRNRNRSHSVGGGNSERVASPGCPTMEWLGLHTVKGFAGAAGLLDHNVNKSGSRFGSTRSLGDYNQRTLAPSRLAISEAGSVTWRSGSAMTRKRRSTSDCSRVRLNFFLSVAAIDRNECGCRGKRKRNGTHNKPVSARTSFLL
jgi:hypothetical protein